MLLVKTYINKSDIHGIGCFADEFISKDTLIWQLSDLELNITKERFKELPDTAQDYLRKFADWDKELGRIIMSFDNDKYMNHSFAPNVRFDNQKTYAVRDIQKGEELTINYYEFDESADDKLHLSLF